MRRSAIVLLMMVLCLGASSAHADLFNDGGTHDVDYTVTGHLDVYDGPGSTTTTVNFLTGGLIEDPYHLRAYQNSLVNVYGGLIEEDLRAEDSSLVNVYGGLIKDELRALDSSLVHVYGGSIEKDLLAFSSSVVNVFGGLIKDELRAHTNSVVNVYGGSIAVDLLTEDGSLVNVYGGLIGDDLLAYDSSVVNVYGHGFNYPYGPITATSGTLTGTLSSGDPLSVGFNRDSGATINLAPAPGAFVLGSIGLSFAGWKLRRRRTL